MTSFARHWPLWALAACVLMLAAAHAFETLGHMAPCTLCLKQREIYWGAMGIAAAGVVLGFTRFGAIATRVTNVLLAIAFLYGAIVAAYHAGVEWKWWPGPASCSGGAHSVNAADLAALLRGARATAPACDKAAWVFLGVSMAGWNALISLGLAAYSTLAVSGGRPAEQTVAP